MYCLKIFKMFQIVVVSAIFALSNSDPLGCCMPARYSGMIQEVGGIVKSATTGDVIDNMIELHYDWGKQMMTAVSHMLGTNGMRGNTTVIYDYKNGRQHILPEDGTCKTEQLNSSSMYNPCLIQNFTYGETFTVGSSINKFEVNTFDGMLGSLHLGVVVTADHCIPVADKLYGGDGKTQSILAVVFMNIDPNGVNDAMFNVPTKCNVGVVSTGVGKRDLEALGLRRRPLAYE